MPKLLYQEIRKQIFKTIKEKKLQKGDLLPSEWEFVSLLKTSRPTIRKALNELSEMGIVESIRGKGTVLITNNLSQVAEGRTYELALFFVDDEELYNKPSSIFNIVNGITREVVCSGHKITLNRFTHDSLSAGEVPKEEALKADGFLTLWLWKKEFLQTLIACNG